MPTVSGDLGDLTGEPLVFPNGNPARAYLTPTSPFVITGSTVRYGGIALTLDDDDNFSQTGVANGDYQLIVYYFDPAKREPAVKWWTVHVFGDTVVSV